jgi:chromosome segregation ATPase
MVPRKDFTRAKGLSDLRTALTARVHAKPPQKGTAHLDLYLLGKEKQRLEKELARLDQERVRLGQRQRRIQAHLTEIRQAMAILEQETEQERSSEDPSSDIEAREKQPAPASQYGQQRWKKMTIDY